MRDSGNAPGSLEPLVRAVAGGSRAAFSELYARTAPRVYALALRMTERQDAAAEIVEQVYLKAWASAGSYGPRVGTPMTWLLSLTHLCAVQSSRTAAAQGVTAGAVPAHADAPSAGLERGEAGSSQALPEGQDEALLLAYYGGLTCGEVAEKLSVAVPTAVSRIRTAVGRLTSPDSASAAAPGVIAVPGTITVPATGTMG